MKEIKSLKINKDIFTDKYLGADYEIARANAKDVKKYLISTLESQGINPLNYNIINVGHSSRPDVEIYEYQPFFLLERKDGSYSLLDGFRRLIYHDPPNHMITIRIYQEKDLTQEQIMKLMIYLNHFKFFIGGTYYDRGFALSLKTLFGLDIPKYYKLMDSYLTLNNTERYYINERIDNIEKNESVKIRLLNPKFISDMNFFDKLSDTDYKINIEFGALYYNFRKENPDFDFHPEIFIQKMNENKFIQDLQVKYKKLSHDGHGERDKDIVNQLMKLYSNIFNEMLGKEVKKTYTEKVNDCKKLVKELKKDKSLIKLTGLREIHIAEDLLKDKLKSDDDVKFTCVVFPKEERTSDNWGFRKKEITKDHIIEPGILDEDIYLINTEEKTFGGFEMVFGFIKGEIKYRIRHNWGDYRSYSKKYTTLDSLAIGIYKYKIELFVNISQKEFKEAKDKHYKFRKKYKHHKFKKNNMAVIGIEYCEESKLDNLGYECVYLHTRDSKEHVFDSGDFIKDWYMCLKEFLNKPNEFHLAHSSSVDHFIMDGAPYDEGWIVFKEDATPYIVYDYPDKSEKIRIFVKKGTRPTFKEYKEYIIQKNDGI